MINLNNYKGLALLKNSNMYKQVTTALKNDKKLNKFKAKIAYFWYKIYELTEVNGYESKAD